MITTILVATHYSIGSCIYVKQRSTYRGGEKRLGCEESVESAANSQINVDIHHNAHFRLPFFSNCKITRVVSFLLLSLYRGFHRMSCTYPLHIAL